MAQQNFNLPHFIGNTLRDCHETNDNIFQHQRIHLNLIVIVIGLYSVMWGKANEGKMVKINLESQPKFD
ncbi:hypothetical protein LguiB_016185 [Lonicera macranthoides]